MSCPKWKNDIALYAGGDLPPRRLAGTVAHLEACGECRALADDLRADQTLLVELRDEAAEDEMAAIVRRRVLARLPVEGARAAHRYWGWASAVGLILAAILMFPRRTEKQAPIARRQIAPVRLADAPPATVFVPPTVVPRRHHGTPARHGTTTQPGEPLLVQLVTEDPNIVIYWLVDPKPQGD